MKISYPGSDNYNLDEYSFIESDSDTDDDKLPINTLTDKQPKSPEKENTKNNPLINPIKFIKNSIYNPYISTFKDNDINQPLENNSENDDTPIENTNIRNYFMR